MNVEKPRNDNAFQRSQSWKAQKIKQLHHFPLIVNAGQTSVGPAFAGTQCSYPSSAGAIKSTFCLNLY